MSPSPTPDADDFRSDEELARAHQRGDAAAFASLVRRHEARVRAFVFGDPGRVSVGDTIVRHVWSAAERNIREGKCRGPFRVWLFKMADAVAAKHVGNGPSERASALATCFGRLLKSKPKLHRIVMWVSHGLNRTVVARRHRMTKARLKGHYTRAVAAVRDCMSGRSDTPTDLPNSEVAQ
jgi:hypothetical protein